MGVIPGTKYVYKQSLCFIELSCSLVQASLQSSNKVAFELSPSGLR